MPFRRAGRPGLIGTMARTAVGAGTASAVVNRSNDRRDARQQAAYQDQQSQQQQQQPAVPQQASAPSSGDDTMAKLQQLADMKSKGLLSDQEFAAMKGKLLGI
jgi:hypothetical protein